MIEHTLIRPQQSYMFRLIAKNGKLPERCRIISDRLLAQLGRGKLALMEGLCPDFPLLLEAVNNIFVAPTNFVRKALYCAVFPPWLQSKDPQSFWYNHSLLPIIRRRDALEEFQTFKGGSTA